MITSNLNEVVEALRAGEVVALPTETVYGLAALASSDKAVEKVFEVKKRPANDPLIVHVSNIEMAENLSPHWTPQHQKLAENFWPGPLTLIAEKSPHVSSRITSNLNTVAIRWARNDDLNKIIDELNEPIVAPSANMFGKTSPTCAEHVEDEFSGAVTVFDGGECEIGIESTVVSFEDEKPCVLRPGLISPSAIQLVLGSELGEGSSPTASPGHLPDHYQPNKPLIIVDEGSDVVLPESLKGLKMGNELKLPENPREAAQALYREIRALDRTRADYIYVVRPKNIIDSVWLAVWDRLEKAATQS